MSASIVESVRQQIDDAPLSLTQLVVFCIAFLLNVVDGFDVVAMSVSMPALTTEWAITSTEKGYILSSALIGMTLGAMYLAPLADRIGRRNILLIATVMIGLSMIVTAFIPQSIELMMLIRCVSGLGIGIIFANSATIGTEFAPEKWRNLAVTIIVMGYPFGATIVGPIANMIIPASGWEMVFVYGGIFTLLMTVVIYIWLPESVEFIASQNVNNDIKLQKINGVLAKLRCQPIISLPESVVAPQEVSVKNLFRHGLMLSTLGIWLIYFMGFMSLYFLMSWIPTLFVNSGYARSQGIAALTIYNLGAVAGIIAIGLLVTRIKLAKPIAVYFFGSAVVLTVVYYNQPKDVFWLNMLIFVIGFLLQGGFTAMYALAARTYPTAVRATGIGWAAGLGRVGAILSPILAGYLVTASWGMYDLFLLFALPLFISALIVAFYKD